MLSPDEKKAQIWIHEDHDSPLARQEGGGLRAGIFLLDGRYHVAAHTSPFERRLRERGALHVADLVVDPDPAERAALSGGTQMGPAPGLSPLGRWEAAAAFRPALHPN
jgi:hypothetical protein